ncbi:MAG: hypothetical protein MJ139_04785, partial [Limosilactobacillus sp.]|nr:hypothetical protein [Limosilactobacillus sp.]
KRRRRMGLLAVLFFCSVLVSAIIYMVGYILEEFNLNNGLVVKTLQVVLLIASMVAFGTLLSIVVLAGLAVF